MSCASDLAAVAMITVTAKLNASLRKYLPPGSDGLVTVELEAGATVADLLAKLAVPADHARMILSGDEYLDPASLLRDGQQIHLFPPLAGG